MTHAAGVGEGKPFGEEMEAAGPSFTRRSTARSSGVTVGVFIGRSSKTSSGGEGIGDDPFRSADREVVGVVSEAPGRHGAGQRCSWMIVVFGAAFEHAADEPDVTWLVVGERRCAGGVDT